MARQFGPDLRLRCVHPGFILNAKVLASPSEKAVVAASGFTTLWALTWIGTEALPLDPSIQGGFAVGGVMASSGLALLWWKTRTMRQLHPNEESEG